MKRFLLMSVIATLLGTGVSAQLNSSSAQGYITRASRMLDDGNFSGCRHQASMALSQSATPDEQHDARLLLALSALNHKDDDARQLLEDFLKRYPSSPRRSEILMALADLDFDRRQYGSALVEYLAVDERALDAASAQHLRYRRAYCRLLTADYDLSAQDFASLQGTKTYGNASIFYQGYIAYCKRDYATAERLLSQVNQATTPGDKAPYYLMQIAYINGNNDKALSLAEKLMNTHSNNVTPQFSAEAHRIAGEIYYAQGNESKAMSVLSKYPALATQAGMEPVASALYVLGLMEYSNAQYQQAIEHLTPATNGDNAMVQNAYYHIGQCYRLTGNSNAALVAFEKASRMEFDRGVQEAAFYNYAVARMDGGRVPFGSSVAVFEDFLRRFPESSHATRIQDYIIDGYITDNDFDSALRSINQIDNPSQQVLDAKQRVLYSIGMRQMSTANTTEALKSFTQAAAVKASNSDISSECNLWIGDCHFRMGNYEKAAKAYLAYLKTASSSAQNRPLTLYNLGYSRYMQKQYDDAATNFKKVIESPRGLSNAIVADALNRMGDCYYHKSQFDDAAKYYDRAYQRSPYVGDYSLFQKAVMKGYAKDYSGKIKTLALVEEKFPSSGLLPAVLLEKAEAYVALDDNTHAIKTYRQLVKQYPSTQQGRSALLQLAITHSNNKNKSEAIKTYKEVISTYPTSEEARVAADDLKRIYADDGQLDQYAAFIESIPGAPQLDRREIDLLTFQAAEKDYLKGTGTTKLASYIEQFPSGIYRAQALFYMCLAANDAGNKDTALQYATEIVEQHPDAESVEDALAIKGQIEFDQGKGEVALETFKSLKQRASSTANLKTARLGIMRVSSEIADNQTVMAVVDELTASLPAECEEMPEIKFCGAKAAYRAGNHDEAIKQYTALAKDPSNLYGAMAAVNLSQHYLDNNNLKKARTSVEALVNSNTPHQYWLARGFIILSDINRAEGNTFEANEYLKTLRDNYPGSEADIFQLIEQRLSNQ